MPLNKLTTIEKGSIEELQSTILKRRNKQFSENPLEQIQIEKRDRIDSLSDIEKVDGVDGVDGVSPRHLKYQLSQYFDIQVNKIPEEELTTLKNSFEKRQPTLLKKPSEAFRRAFLGYLESKNLKSLDLSKLTERALTKRPSILMKAIQVAFVLQRKSKLLMLKMINL